MTLKLFSTTVLALSMSACSFQQESAQSPEEKAATEVIQSIEQQKFDGQLSEENVKVEFVEQETPGMYLLVASWPKDVPGMKVSVNGSPYTIVNDANAFSKSAIHGVTFKLHLIALNSIGGEISSFEVTKTAPSDLIVGKNTELHQDTQYTVNRTYFPAGASIITNSYNLSIETNKLYVSTDLNKNTPSTDPTWAQILTNAPGSAASDRNQLKSSHIYIKAEKALGVLRVGMFGLNGLDGKPSVDASYNTSLDGQSGTPGQIQSHIEPCADVPCKRKAPQIICSKNPTPGLNGKKGFSGGAGQDGMNGGDTGTLAVVVNDSSEFQMEISLKAGVPGKGGAGGKGSPGGKGGAAGENPQNKCASAQPGTDGPVGDSGPAGKNGLPGKAYEPVTNIKNISVFVSN